MKLHTREWGTGDRIAVLIHGIMSDSRTWHRVAPRLVDHGYRVIAVDLRGHGHSPRGSYSPQEWAEDLLDTVPTTPDLAIGHSLGAVALALAADRLAPVRAVYCDPPWQTVNAEPLLDLSVFARFKSATREQITAMNPRWDPTDVDVEIATLRLWDPETIEGAKLIAAADPVPDQPRSPSLVQLASESFLRHGPTNVEDLRNRGLEVRVVQDVGHCIHRDDLDAFLAGLDGWL
ncbi:alpha/beta fold hydrolase [Streptomyces sp. NPDC059373]